VPGSFETLFASNHPTAEGHFPGNPIIPGALVLDVILSAIIGDKEAPTLAYELRAAKFHRPIRPGDRVRIDWHEAHGDIRFQCLLINSDEVALTGTIRLGTDSR